MGDVVQWQFHAVDVVLDVAFVEQQQTGFVVTLATSFAGRGIGAKNQLVLQTRLPFDRPRKRGVARVTAMDVMVADSGAPNTQCIFGLGPRF